jgi:uncharacterized membrane protein YhaH (DUF805 family)
MRAERFGAISGLENKMPDALYIGFVDSLLVEVKGLIVSGVAVAAAGIVAAIASHSVSLWICAALMILVSAIRLYVMRLHARSRPSADVAIARRWEASFVAGAIAYMGLLAIWTFVAFCATDDAFTRRPSRSATHSGCGRGALLSIEE